MLTCELDLWIVQKKDHIEFGEFKIHIIELKW
jgi:hypothetical protein